MATPEKTAWEQPAYGGVDPMTPITIAQLRARSTVDLMTAACALSLGRTKA